MDNEALVDQIVRSLSFEVVAAPQNVIPVDSTSKTTPVNVKIKVRKKQGAGLRHGVISMPQVDTRSDTRKQEPRERIRLVSSDHTIMDFDVLMEAEFDKGALANKKKQNLNMIAPESQDEDRSVNELNKLPIFAKRNKDIFGKCKPGGCLDPPFGEDKYPYQPITQNLRQPLKDDSAKLRSSSIFKNNIFKKKRKSSQGDAQLDITNPRNTAETNCNLHETGSLTQHSNPLITYPHPSFPKRVQKQDEKRLSKEDGKSKRNSSDEKSSSIGKGSYYIIPKKTKKLSNQSDTQEKPDTKPVGANIKYLKSELEEDYNNVTEIKPAPTKDSKFIPIPLIVPINALTDDIHNTGALVKRETITEPVVSSFDDDNHVKDPSRAVGDNNVSLEPKTKSDPEKKEDESDTDINDSSTQNVAATNKEEGNERTVFLNAPRDESPDSEKPQSASNDDKTLGSDSKNQIDPKSHPLLPDAREKAVIGITDSLHIVPEDNNTLQLSDQNNIPFSSNNLKEIWENENDPLKSTADVIFRDNIPNVRDYTLNSDQNSTISTNSDKSLLPDKIAENVKTEDNLSPKETVYFNDIEPIKSVESSKISQSLGTADNYQTKPQDNLSDDINNKLSNDYLGNIENNSQRKPEDNLTHYINENPNDDYLTENDQDSNKYISLDCTDEHPRETKTIAEKSPTDKEEDPAKMLLNEPLESNNSEHGTVTVENIIDLKKVRSVSDLSIVGSVHDEDLNKPNYVNKDTLPTTKPQTNTETTSHISFKLDQLPLNEFSDALARTTDNIQVVQPPSILKKAFWKMDIALQSYIDENNERIIKSFDSKNTPQRQANDTVLVAQCYLGSDVNEIKIPVDRENDLNVKIAQNTLGPKLPIAYSSPDFVDISKKNNITIDTPVSATILDATIQSKANKSDAVSYNDGNLNNDVRNALNKVYEEELLPLQDLIKGLREEIDTLVSFQMKFKEVQRVSKPAPKRARPVRLLQQNKRCACTKKI